MPEFPLVSVIVPTHDRPHFLSRTLQSIVNQTYKNLQIIVVSNGFNPANKETVDEFHDERIEYYEQRDSGGPASPRNNGINRSTGKYIAFCDDDDLWLPEKIQKQVEILEKNTRYGLCYTKMLRFNDNKEWDMPHEAGKADFQSLLFTNTIPVSSIFMKLSLIKQYGGFSESKKVGHSEDYEFILRYALKTEFYFLEDFLIKYWSGDNRTSCLSFKKSLRLPISHFLTIIRIYIIIFKINRNNIFLYLKPFFYNLHNTLKIILYLLSRP